MMPLHIEMFPPVVLALQQEIRNHPKLQQALATLPSEANLEERFGLIAAYCGMVVDGYYNEEAVDKLFHIALDKLRKMGTVIIH